MVRLYKNNYPKEIWMGISTQCPMDKGTQSIFEEINLEEKSVSDWIAIAKHPVTKKHYNEMIYQPMVELLDYLRANGYKTFIVSGGGIDFMRVWAEKAYGIPPYQVVGSSVKSKYEVGADGKPFLTKLPELNFNDDKEGKPVGIHQHINRFCIGNALECVVYYKLKTLN